MFLIALLLFIAAGLYLVEQLWPAQELPVTRAWWPRVVVINLIQAGIVVLAGWTWDEWLRGLSLFSLRQHFSDPVQAIIAYIASTFVYYWWHRFRHESRFFWRLCHQLHHSPARIELVTSFYKHPVEIALNSIISAALVYAVLGCSTTAGAMYTFLAAIAEYFYHLNIRTPRWVGFLVQRPESHRLHHKYRHHTQNFADLPIWDMIFGTFMNPREPISRCGYDAWREDRFEDMLFFRDVHAKHAESTAPLQLLPTCIGCKKRFACALQNQIGQEERND